MNDYNNLWIRLTVSLLLSLPSYPLLHLIRNLPFSRITGYAFWQYSLTVFFAFVILFEFQNLNAHFLSRYLSWDQSPIKRLTLELLISLIMSAMVVSAAYSTLYIYVWEMDIFVPSIILYTTIVFFISLGFMVFVNAAPVVSQWKSSIVKAEKLEKQSATARLEALRNQLSPHFFFNNLSILNGLVDSEPAEAKEFIARLSEVFRYILTHKNEEVVPLKTELEFIDDYLFLLQMRYKNKLKVALDVDGAQEVFLPPVTLQQLIENALKHNEVSEKHPLEVKVEIKDASLVVENNLQPRKNGVTSTGFGLMGIKERFKLLTDQQVLVEQTTEYFKVQLPLIRI